MKKIVFYDLETTGKSSYWDQIIQIAAVCTDEDLRVIDKINFIGRINSFCVPDPEALLVNRIPIKNIYRSNFSNYNLTSEVYKKFHDWSPAIFIGYNSISFDEEMLRNAFFKMLYDPYLTIKNKNSRTDLLNTTRISNFFFPEKIKSLINKRGSSILKLESVANTNGIKNFTAHDALGDTYATLELAKLIKTKTPKVWEKSIRNIDKSDLENIISSKPFCYLESIFGKTKLFCLSFIGFHPLYKWALCFDLLENPEEILKMNNSELFTFLETSPKKIRKLKLNKSPILLDINIRKNIDDFNIITDDILMKRHNFIRNNPELKQKVLNCYQDNFRDELSQTDIYAEETIYKKFISSADNMLMKTFQKSCWNEKARIMYKFKDERLKYFAELLLFEEKPELLDSNMIKKIKIHQSERLFSKNKEKWLTIAEAYKKIDDLRAKYDNNNHDNLIILEDINKYIENLEKKLQ